VTSLAALGKSASMDDLNLALKLNFPAFLNALSPKSQAA
jgi:hypothetical protein